MGTYDTYGGSPISPNEPDPHISQDEEDALGVLEDLDKARDSAKAVLQPLFRRIIAKRYPVGREVDIRRIGRVLSGHTYGLHKGIVDGHKNEAMNWSSPETMRVGVVCRLLNKDGAATKHRVIVMCYVVDDFGARTARDQLCDMIADLQTDAALASDAAQGKGHA